MVVNMTFPDWQLFELERVVGLNENKSGGAASLRKGGNIINKYEFTFDRVLDPTAKRADVSARRERARRIRRVFDPTAKRADISARRERVRWIRRLHICLGSDRLREDLNDGGLQPDAGGR